MKEKNSNQKDKLFIRGKHISTKWKHKGISKLDRPPILKGITKKKIM